ncbi:hypothetical protein V1508DRAFT_435851 [Lipomyces doorenjongii]|uniref:uncharacterized protein n=1 Tax=Lipomyces doorenjongii TaxID=383834 RepID=UPI0034CDD94C
MCICRNTKRGEHVMRVDKSAKCGTGLMSSATKAKYSLCTPHLGTIKGIIVTKDNSPYPTRNLMCYSHAHVTALRVVVRHMSNLLRDCYTITHVNKLFLPKEEWSERPSSVTDIRRCEGWRICICHRHPPIQRIADTYPRRISYPPNPPIRLSAYSPEKILYFVTPSARLFVEYDYNRMRDRARNKHTIFYRWNFFLHSWDSFFAGDVNGPVEIDPGSSTATPKAQKVKTDTPITTVVRRFGWTNVFEKAIEDFLHEHVSTSTLAVTGI